LRPSSAFLLKYHHSKIHIISKGKPMVIFSFCLFLCLFIGIGLLSVFKAQKNNADYLLAGSDIKPWLVALSAVATNNSGYMFIGMIGFTYTTGLSSAWLMIGWILGDLVASLFIHKKLRNVTGAQEALSFSGVLARWYGTEYKKLRFISGLIVVIFLGTYAAAQFKAGSKALHVLFGWDYSTGAIIGAVMVFLYCMAGGIRASIWTDAAQSFVMIIAMTALLVFGVQEVGGTQSFIAQLNLISEDYLSLFPASLGLANPLHGGLFVLGWFFAGLGVVGQPHIMVRFMSMDNSKNMNRVRLYYYSWFTAFYGLTIGVGLVARLLLTDTANFDSELALPMIANELLPQFFIGLVLAGLFAATMSTADSQILSCSAAITRDLLPKEKSTYLMTKLATVFTTICALIIALFGTENVFGLVLIAWSVLAAAFGPILFLYAMGQKLREGTAIAMLVVGVGMTVIWRFMGLGDIIYEIAPGMLAGLLTFAILHLAGLNKWSDDYLRNS
jgi:sodium/proline symporter